jgi:hypothetical protein
MKWLFVVIIFFLPGLLHAQILIDTTFSEVKHFNESDWQNFSKNHEYGEAKSRIKKAQTNIHFPEWVKYIVYILVIGLLVFLIYKLIMLLYSPLNRKLKVKDAIVVLEESDEILFDDNLLEDKIAEAISQKDYRRAIRFSYLFIIRELSKAKLIHAAKDKTNYEYIQELNLHPYAIQFLTISRSFEKTWYGEIIPSSSEYTSFENTFNILRSQLSGNNSHS